MKKKGFVWGLVLVLAMGLLSGCGSESAASMTEETAAAEAPVEEYSMDAAADYGTGNASMMPAAMPQSIRRVRGSSARRTRKTPAAPSAVQSAGSSRMTAANR